MSGMKNGRASGPNELIAELLKAGGLPMMHQLLPICLKALIAGEEPVSWRGGRLFALYKGKGSPQQPDSYQSIFLSNVRAKLHHSWIRKSFEKLWHCTQSSVQFGGRKARGADLTHRIIQAAQLHARVQRRSMGILFLDLRSAFSVSRLECCLTGLALVRSCVM